MRRSQPLVIHLVSRLRPEVVARMTREAYSAGRDVTWVATKHHLIRKAAAALGDWRAAYGTSMRLEGRTAVMFAHSDEGHTLMTYWPRR